MGILVSSTKDIKNHQQNGSHKSNQYQYPNGYQSTNWNKEYFKIATARWMGRTCIIILVLKTYYNVMIATCMSKQLKVAVSKNY